MAEREMVIKICFTRDVGNITGEPENLDPNASMADAVAKVTDDPANIVLKWADKPDVKGNKTVIREYVRDLKYIKNHKVAAYAQIHDEKEFDYVQGEREEDEAPGLIKVFRSNANGDLSPVGSFRLYKE